MSPVEDDFNLHQGTSYCLHLRGTLGDRLGFLELDMVRAPWRKPLEQV